MISRRIKCKPENDDYRRLANYIADAEHDGGKTLLAWCSGCWSGDDEYELAVSEVEAVQALNVRTSREKTYHLTAVRLKFNKEVQNLNELWYKGIEKSLYSQGDFGHGPS